jgi:hypothetical protein
MELDLMEKGKRQERDKEIALMKILVAMELVKDVAKM